MRTLAHLLAQKNAGLGMEIPANLPAALPAGYHPAGGTELLAGGLLMFMLVVSLIALGLLIFWIWMLIDCLKRDFPDKTVWLVILIVSLLVQFHWLAAIIYYVLVKRKNVGSVTPPAAPSPPPATPPAPPAAN